MQRKIKHLPSGYARMCCDKLFRDGYDIQPYNVYYVHKLSEYNPNKKLILSALHGMAVNHYQKKIRFNQRIIKEEAP